MFRNLDFYGLVPSSSIGQIDYVLEKFETQDTEQIEWMIIGDSQTRDGARPPLIAHELGVQPDKIFNLSLSAGKPVDNLRLLKKVLPQLPNLKGVLIGVNEYQFNNSVALTDSKFRFNSNLRQRLNVGKYDQKASLLLGYLSYTYGMRDIWKEIIKTVVAGGGKVNADNYVWGIVPDAKEKQKSIEKALPISTIWTEDYQIEGPYTDAFIDMIQLLENRNINWDLLYMPRTNAFNSTIHDNFEEQHQQFLNLMREVSRPNSKGVQLGFLNLQDDSFRDTIHLNEKGARKIAADIAQIIKGLDG